MILPIESSMSLYTVDHKAHEVQNDPNAHTAQAMHQDEAVKKNLHQLHTVQKSPETEGGVKIRDENRGKNRNGQQKNKRSRDGGESAPEEERSMKSGGGRLNFLA